MKNISFLTSIGVLGISLTGCANPQAQQASLSATPDLSPYVRIELYAPGSSASEPPAQLRSQFGAERAQFEVVRADGSIAGRLHVQPDDCRDDPSASCERRFSISGRLQVFGVNLSCVVPVRNDVNVGYGAQTLSGLCQSQYGRAYTLNMFPR